MYGRKTANAEELSAARRRAAQARKSCRGGRPRIHTLPSKSLKVDALDAAIFAAYGKMKGISVAAVMHRLAWLLVCGGQSEAHTDCHPAGWKI